MSSKKYANEIARSYGYILEDRSDLYNYTVHLIPEEGFRILHRYCENFHGHLTSDDYTVSFKKTDVDTKKSRFWTAVIDSMGGHGPTVQNI